VWSTQLRPRHADRLSHGGRPHQRPLPVGVWDRTRRFQQVPRTYPLEEVPSAAAGEAPR
jgi:hypothetical protein